MALEVLFRPPQHDDMDSFNRLYRDLLGRRHLALKNKIFNCILIWKQQFVLAKKRGRSDMGEEFQ